MRHLRYIGAFIRTVVREFMHDHGPLTAAAMSFFATLSLLPLLLVGVSALGYRLGSEEAFRDVMTYFRQYTPAPSAQLIEDTMRTMVETRRSAGFVGLGLLLWTASSVFNHMETALCITWNVAKRPLWKSRLLSLAMLVMVGAGLLVSLGFAALTIRFTAIKWGIFGYRVPDLPALWRFAAFGVPVFIGILTFAAVYYVMPNVRVHWRASLLGGVFGGLLWQAALHGFRAYLVYARYDVLYGSLGGVMVMVLWIYYSMIALLLGAEVAWQADQRLRAREGRSAETPAEKLSTPARL